VPSRAFLILLSGVRHGLSSRSPVCLPHP
jgi:hypothetical protein